MDPYDAFDDDFFDDPDALKAIDAAETLALSSQLPLPRQSQRYHHTVSVPKAAAPFGRRKDGTPRDPAPLNVTPGVVAGGFGWEHGGKRVVKGNVQRHLAAIDQRQAYWRKEEDPPMDMVVDSTGRYAREDDEVVDIRHQPISESLASQARRPTDPKSAQARRAAMAAAMEETPARPFARSVSAGSHLRPQPVAGPSRLEPIASQSSQGSQGSAVRKLHLDLENEKKKREELERELEKLKAPGGWEIEVDVNLDEEERKKKIQALQLKVYEAEGRAATLERNKQKDITRYASEADKLKVDIEALQAQMQAREREFRHQLESLKSQAVFNNHAVMNTVARSRTIQSSQRPKHTPGGSPSRRGNEEAAPLIRSAKGKAPPPQPGFKTFVNAFDVPDGRKRQRTEAPSPTKLSQSGLRTPEPSPVKFIEEEPMEQVEEEPDRRAELLHHLFNYSYVSTSYTPTLGPTLFRILNHSQPEDPEGYSRCGSDILRACGDLSLDVDGVMQVLASSFLRMIGICRDVIASEIVLNDLLAMTSRTAFAFPSFVDQLIVAEPNLGSQFAKLARTLINSEFIDLICDLGEALCLYGDGRIIWRGSDLVDTIILLSGPVRDRGVDLFFSAACSPTNFRALTGPSDEHTGPQPLLDEMARNLMAKDLTEIHRISIIRAFSMLAVSDLNGVLLISERTVLVPCLAQVLHRESSKVWGINYNNSSIQESLSLLYLSLLLLHHLAYPSPQVKATEPALAEPDPEPEPDQGLNFSDRFQAATHTKEFNGVLHVFQAALGTMAFADVDVDEGNMDELRSIQYLSQDLLEAVAEGPEVDAIYEIYAGEGDMEGIDPEVYAEIQVIE